jgi:hypothetical protein
VEDIDMLSSADMLIAHGIIAVDANACDAPKRKSTSANAVVKSRRTVSSLSMPGTVLTSRIAVKDASATVREPAPRLFNVRLIPSRARRIADRAVIQSTTAHRETTVMPAQAGTQKSSWIPAGVYPQAGQRPDPGAGKTG